MILWFLMTLNLQLKLTHQKIQGQWPYWKKLPNFLVVINSILQTLPEIRKKEMSYSIHFKKNFDNKI